MCIFRHSASYSVFRLSEPLAAKKSVNGSFTVPYIFVQMPPYCWKLVKESQLGHTSWHCDFHFLLWLFIPNLTCLPRKRGWLQANSWRSGWTAVAYEILILCLWGELGWAGLALVLLGAAEELSILYLCFGAAFTWACYFVVYQSGDYRKV